MIEKIKNRIFNIRSTQEFSEIALSLFQWQYENNEVYHSFVNALGVSANNINDVEDIPFIPISFFKSHKVISSKSNFSQVFTSSGTTGQTPSKHYVTDISLYESSFRKGFEHFFGHPQKYCILALLPSYSERTGSSLIYMVNDLMKTSGHPENEYFLRDHESLRNTLKRLKDENQKTILIGVSFALLDFTETQQLKWDELILMETGGMKGRRKEWIRSDLHKVLKKSFSIDSVYSEYGMTELFSQAYSFKDGFYKCPPWMKILIRDTMDPLSLVPNEFTGGINVIDLANIYSCSFIATEDLGKNHSDGSFEVLGRFDEAEVRGCNLMV